MGKFCKETFRKNFQTMTHPLGVCKKSKGRETKLSRIGFTQSEYKIQNIHKRAELIFNLDQKQDCKNKIISEKLSCSWQELKGSQCDEI